MPALVVVGSLNMDFVVSVEHLQAPGETVLGRDFQMVPGGKGANQARAAAKLSTGALAVRMIGRVGYDVFADHLMASLSAAGVDVSNVHAAHSQQSHPGRAMLRQCGGGDFGDPDGRATVGAGEGGSGPIEQHARTGGCLSRRYCARWPTA